MASLLEIDNLSKRYASPVLVEVRLDLRAGEVHALVGANGAGKTTLAHTAGGLIPPGRGRMRLGGEPYAPSSRRAAERLGVRMVLQEPSVIDTLSIAENIFLDHLPRRLGFIDYPRLHADARPLLRRVGLSDLDPACPAGRLGTGQRQAVEIAAALSRPCRLLILDEPTSALTSPEIERLFAQIDRLRRAGTAVLYISHRLDEVRSIADRATVLRDGRVVATEPVAALPVRRIVELMVGGSAVETGAPGRGTRGEVALHVDGLGCGTAVRDVGFEVRCGEILGLAGLVGSGRTETLRALFGADPPDAGRVRVAGRRGEAPFSHPREAVAAGVGLVPEDRARQGLLMPHSIRVNTTLAALTGPMRAGGWIRRAAERRAVVRLSDALGVRRSSIEQPVAELSGGNQQKVLMNRWLLRDCRLLLLDEPTRGVDVAAKRTIHRLLVDLARRGKALVVASSEIDELMTLCDRIAVLSAGRLVETFERGAWTEAAITHAAFRGYLDAGVAGA